MNKLPIIEKGQYGQIDFSNGRGKKSGKMLVIFLSGLVVFFLFLIGRLFQLTIVKGVYYKDLSEQNRIRELIIEPKRGKIIDRMGYIIAQNVAADTSSDAARLISKRRYEQTESFSHILGYRQLADKNDIDNDPCLNKLKVGDKVGKKGIEKLYDCDLRGTAGKKLIEIDAHGNFKNTLDIIEPVDGAELQLAIDSDLQQKAYDLIVGKRAVVVALKPKTGEVLVMTSSPAFNPQAFEDSDNKVISQLFADKSKPMFNRATEGIYPPGSTFKIVVASGALQDKTVSADYTIEDKGVLEAGPLKFHNWFYLEYGKTDGLVNVNKAIQRSNDIYFYQIGAKMGADKIKFWAERFGYHNQTRIGIEEAAGVVPSAFWKEDVLKEKWYLGDTYNLSIGQGYLLATPLQVAVSTMPFANGGYICKPQLLKKDTPHAGKVQCEKVPVSEKNIETIREAMKAACTTGGTGWPLFDFKVKDPTISETPTPVGTASAALANMKTIETGCKTGTAESHANSGKPHAWFTAFAPYENPEIVVTVLVEESGQGSDVAGPIVRDVLKVYFERTD